MRCIFSAEKYSPEKEILDRSLGEWFSIIRRRISKTTVPAGECVFVLSGRFICDTDYGEAVKLFAKSDSDVTLIYTAGCEESPFYIKHPYSGASPKISHLFLKGYTCDTESPESIRGFITHILDGKSSFALPGRKKSGVVMGKNTRLTVGARLNPPVYLGNSSVAEKNTEIDKYSVIGSGSVISEGAKILGGIIGRGCFIGKNAVIGRGAIIEDGCFIGEETEIKPGITVKKGEHIEKGPVAASEWDFKNFCLSAADTGFSYCCEKGRGRIAVGYSGAPFGEMQKNGIISGIMCAGGEAVDMGAVPLFAFRDGILRYSASGGIYINEDAYMNPLFIGIRGTREEPPKKNTGCWAQVSPSLIKPVLTVRNAVEIYSLNTASFIRKGRKNGFIFFSCSSEKIRGHLKALGNRCGITPVEVNEKKVSKGALKVIFKDNGEIRKIYKSDGEEMTETEFLLRLASACISSGSPKALIPCPPEIPLPSGIIRVAEKGEALIKKVDSEGLEEEKRMLTDPCYAVMKIASEKFFTENPCILFEKVL